MAKIAWANERSRSRSRAPWWCAERYILLYVLHTLSVGYYILTTLKLKQSEQMRERSQWTKERKSWKKLARSQENRIKGRFFLYVYCVYVMYLCAHHSRRNQNPINTHFKKMGSHSIARFSSSVFFFALTHFKCKQKREWGEREEEKAMEK